MRRKQKCTALIASTARTVLIPRASGAKCVQMQPAQRARE